MVAEYFYDYIFLLDCNMNTYFSNPANTSFNILQPPTNVITIITTIIVCISVDIFIQVGLNEL